MCNVSSWFGMHAETGLHVLILKSNLETVAPGLVSQPRPASFAGRNLSTLVRVVPAPWISTQATIYLVVRVIAAKLFDFSRRAAGVPCMIVCPLSGSK